MHASFSTTALDFRLSPLHRLSFAPRKACRPTLCISPPSPHLRAHPALRFSRSLSFTLHRQSLSFPLPPAAHPTPDTRHPIPNYVKRFRILRPDYAASLPSRIDSLFPSPPFLSFAYPRCFSPTPLSSFSLDTAHASRKDPRPRTRERSRAKR